jgi:hypothetical protein
MSVHVQRAKIEDAVDKLLGRCVYHQAQQL